MNEMEAMKMRRCVKLACPAIPDINKLEGDKLYKTFMKKIPEAYITREDMDLFAALDREIPGGVSYYVDIKSNMYVMKTNYFVILSIIEKEDATSVIIPMEDYGFYSRGWIGGGRN